MNKICYFDLLINDESKVVHYNDNTTTFKMYKLKIIDNSLLEEFKSSIEFDIVRLIEEKNDEVIPVDYFEFYNSISSVYSSKIEGENIDYDSFFKHKFLNVKYQPDYTKKADDLFLAYEYIMSNEISEENIVRAHEIISNNLLPELERGKVRNNPMFVLNENDRIEYVAAEPSILNKEWLKFLDDLSYLLTVDLEVEEVFYYASMIHLVFVKIHPFQDGNGRTARLLEKWFLLDKIGVEATAIELEKNYYVNRKDYYNNIRELGIEYDKLDYSKSIKFLKMTINSLI